MPSQDAREDKIAEEADKASERDVVTVQEANEEKQTAPEEEAISKKTETKFKMNSAQIKPLKK